MKCKWAVSNKAEAVGELPLVAVTERRQYFLYPQTRVVLRDLFPYLSANPNLRFSEEANTPVFNLHVFGPIDKVYINLSQHHDPYLYVHIEENPEFLPCLDIDWKSWEDKAKVKELLGV